MTRVLLAGVSARAAAASAAGAGFAVTAVDAFGDLDQPPGAQLRAVPRFSAPAAARAARDVSCDAVAYLSNFENDPAAVAALAAGRALWGNPPDVLVRVRNPIACAAALRARGVAVPEVSADVVSGFSRAWLVKPIASGGGHRVRAWKPGTRLPRGHFLQERIDGIPASVVFIAAGGRAVPLGVSRQLIGDSAFGVSGYRYCGNILGTMPDLHGAAATLASEAAAAFGLVGANGIDFIDRDGVAVPIEINPRWTASMELVERAHGISVFAAHAAACARGELPSVSDLPAEAWSPEPGARNRMWLPASAGRIVGKAIVFAREDVEMGATRGWLTDRTVADVPHPGERIARGRPICTVFANGDDEAACYAELVRRADSVYASAADRREAVAW